MIELPPSLQLPEIPEKDWSGTPESVKGVVSALLDHLKRMVQNQDQQQSRIEELEKEVEQSRIERQHLQEQLGSNSQNSSKPPSSDPPTVEGKKTKKTGKKRGGQEGHNRHMRELIPEEECNEVIKLYPENCGGCGELAQGEELEVVRHQQIEIPPIKPTVTEYQLHGFRCGCCGKENRAKIPEDAKSAFGPGVEAFVGLFSGTYQLSERKTQSVMNDAFGVDISLGEVDKLRRRVGDLVSEPIMEVQEFVQNASVVNADETSFNQGNADGQNPKRRKAWLWVAVCEVAVLCMVMLNRGQDAAKELLGESFKGILGSDRYSGYNWISILRRQLCWAHLKREFQRIADRVGESKRIGEALLEQEKLLFQYWNRVRDGTLKRSSFQVYASRIRQRIRALLEEGASYPAKNGDKSPEAKTSRTCRSLLKVEPGMWVFVRVPDVEPTNNIAERTIRPAVIWRKLSWGSQSKAGSEFVARMTTVVMTLRKQGRNVLEYLTAVCSAARKGEKPPSLLPENSLD